MGAEDSSSSVKRIVKIVLFFLLIVVASMTIAKNISEIEAVAIASISAAIMMLFEMFSPSYVLSSDVR